MHALEHSTKECPDTAATFSPKIVEQMVQASLGCFDRENGGFSTLQSLLIRQQSIC